MRGLARLLGVQIAEGRAMVITSRSNPFIKYILSLREKKYRREYGEYIAEGIKQVREAHACGCAIEHIVCAESYAGDRFCPDKAVVVSDSVFAKLSEDVAPQGILAVLRIPDEPLAPPRGRCLLLDGVSDPGNLGTIIRTANAAGYEDIYLLGCTDPYSSKCVRASMSGIYFVRLYAGEREELLSAIGDVPLLCADMDGENVFEFQAPDRFCLVIGNEANGVSVEIRKRCVRTVRIPMRKTCESLNAGVSAGILMYELSERKQG